MKYGLVATAGLIWISTAVLVAQSAQSTPGSAPRAQAPSRRIDLEHGLACGGHRALDHALQLSHVPWPSILAEPLRRALGYRLDDGAYPARVPAEDEERNF